MNTHEQLQGENLYGRFGGRFVPETLIQALDQLEQAWTQARDDPGFQEELDQLLAEFVGRPTPLTEARTLSASGARIILKREDLAHTGAHKINSTMGQALLARRMGKNRIIAETGAGQHGVATATACADFGLECEVYMGTEDMRRQELNVFRMRLMGARVTGVDSGSRTLKDATNEAMRDWMGSVQTTHYMLGSVVGPHPFPMIVSQLQSVIGREARSQMLQQHDRLPDAIVACVGGGSNAAGIFGPFVDDSEVRMYGVEAGGTGINPGEHAAPLDRGSPGVLHGSFSYVLQDDSGQTSPVHSCSAGLDYPGVGPEHAHWKETGRVQYTTVEDAQALDAFKELSSREGIIPALESAHAIAAATRIASDMPSDSIVLVNLSGRGDKDVQEAMRLLADHGD